LATAPGKDQTLFAFLFQENLGKRKERKKHTTHPHKERKSRERKSSKLCERVHVKCFDMCQCAVEGRGPKENSKKDLTRLR